MQRLMTAAGISTFALFMLLWMVLAVARTHSDPQTAALAAVLLPGSCQQGCWHGIIFDKTSVDEAEMLLRDDPTLTNVKRNAPDDDFPCVLIWTMAALPGWEGCAYAPYGNHGNPVAFIRLMARPSNNTLALASVLA